MESPWLSKNPSRRSPLRLILFFFLSSIEERKKKRIKRRALEFGHFLAAMDFPHVLTYPTIKPISRALVFVFFKLKDKHLPYAAMTNHSESYDPEDYDPEGYPSLTTRRLTNEKDGEVQDIDDMQRFKVKVVKGGRWRHRRSDVVQYGNERGFEVLTTEEEWADECQGNTYCPKLQCNKCGTVVTSSCINNLQQGQRIMCKCNPNHPDHHWRHRRSDVVQYGNERGFEVLTTEEEWADECHGTRYCPKLQCNKCGTVVTSSCINNLQKGNNIGCSCRNKTEAKLGSWLEKKYPEATVNTQYRGPKTDCGGQTHFDFHLKFSDGFEVLVELDGPQHFCSHLKYYTGEGCERDLLKENWAIDDKRVSVVRVLQEDVWYDRYGWDKYLSEKIEAARPGEPRVFTPAAPEYRSGLYTELRCNKHIE